jgi:hypothetical protein
MCVSKCLAVSVLLVCLSGIAFGQSFSNTAVVPLTVEAGTPLHVVIEGKVRFKESEPVTGRLVEPVYAFDREVIPSGAQVTGRIAGFRKGSKWKRLSRWLAGDFTPVRDPYIEFDMLVLSGGEQIPISTFAAPGSAWVVRSASETDHTSPKDADKAWALTEKVSAGEKFKNFLWGLAPYRPQSIPSGSRVAATLIEPLDFGVAVLAAHRLEDIGLQPVPGTIASVRLLTGLSSRAARPGMSVEAELTRPLFSSDQQLIFPVGSRLIGEVLDADPARSLHRHGRLEFVFKEIEPPVFFAPAAATGQDIEGNLVSIEVEHAMRNLRIGEDGEARISESRKRFIGPAWAFIGAGRSISSHADSFDKALLGAYQSKAIKGISGGESRFGITGSITGAMVPAVGVGLGFYGAARAVYSNFLGKGQDIVIPPNTMMEIRLGETY